MPKALPSRVIADLSIQAGAGTSNYPFIWAMAGGNVAYADVDPIPLETLK